jgi:hypothetical protein
MHGLNEEIFESDYESFEGEGEYEEREGGSYETETEWEAEGGSPFSQEQEMALAAELLSVSSEQELEQFLGSLISSVGKAAGKVISSPTGKALGGLLRKAAKTALPVLGSGPMGAQLGGKLATAGGQLFGLELEGLSNEDQEFEKSRHFVRLAGASARRAVHFSRYMHPRRAARTALAMAARRYAPGLLRNGYPLRGLDPVDIPYVRRRRYGRWPMHDLDRTVPVPVPVYADADGDVDVDAGVDAGGGAADGGAPDLDPEIFGEIAPDAQPPQSPAPGQPGSDALAAPAGYPHHHHRGHHATSGRWVRRGNVLMVLGV